MKFQIGDKAKLKWNHRPGEINNIGTIVSPDFLNALEETCYVIEFEDGVRLGVLSLFLVRVVPEEKVIEWPYDVGDAVQINHNYAEAQYAGSFGIIRQNFTNTFGIVSMEIVTDNGESVFLPVNMVKYYPYDDVSENEKPDDTFHVNMKVVLEDTPHDPSSIGTITFIYENEIPKSAQVKFDDGNYDYFFLTELIPYYNDKQVAVIQPNFVYQLYHYQTGIIRYTYNNSEPLDLCNGELKRPIYHNIATLELHSGGEIEVPMNCLKIFKCGQEVFINMDTYNRVAIVGQYGIIEDIRTDGHAWVRIIDKNYWIHPKCF